VVMDSGREVFVGEVVEEKELEHKKIKGFRLSGRHIFLTYPKVKISRREVLLQIYPMFTPSVVQGYVISTENHADGTEHVHAYIRLDKRCNIRDVERFGLEVVGIDGVVEKRHGNYQTCKS